MKKHEIQSIVAAFGIAGSLAGFQDLHADVIELTWQNGNQSATNPFSDSLSAAPVTFDIDQIPGEFDFAQWNDAFDGTGRTFALFSSQLPGGIKSVRQAYEGAMIDPDTFIGNGAGEGTQFDGSGSAFIGFRTTTGDVGWFKIQFETQGTIVYSVGQLAEDGSPLVVGGNDILLGDVNCDGNVNLLDVEPFVSILISGKFAAKADVNEDGSVDLLDIQPMIELIANG